MQVVSRTKSTVINKHHFSEMADVYNNLTEKSKVFLESEDEEYEEDKSESEEDDDGKFLYNCKVFL